MPEGSALSGSEVTHTTSTFMCRSETCVALTCQDVAKGKTHTHTHTLTASSSSMKMTHGVDLRASANSSRMRAAPRPTNNSTNSLALTARKGMPASPATALAAGQKEARGNWWKKKC
eukprot:1141700-Pelagomonas_calceolata.AAC.4